jgi:hypothetical protein
LAAHGQERKCNGAREMPNSNVMPFSLESAKLNNEESVYNASLLLVEHFKYCIARNGKGIHSRVFSHILHPEEDFVAVGRSKEVIDGAKAHPEHVVPCATLISESFRLINENVPREKIAELLAKHWKIAYISKDQASYLDTKKGLNMQFKMPKDWCFETGDTYARLKLANIQLFPLT